MATNKHAIVSCNMLDKCFSNRSRKYYIAGIGVAAFVNMLAVVGVQYIASIGVSARVQVLAVKVGYNVAGVGVAAVKYIGLCAHGGWY